MTLILSKEKPAPTGEAGTLWSLNLFPTIFTILENNRLESNLPHPGGATFRKLLLSGRGRGRGLQRVAVLKILSERIFQY
jgi:hypothetical protein